MLRNQDGNVWRYADISDYQLNPNMHAYRSAGHVVIARKRTQGTDGSQRRDEFDVGEAHDAGLRVIHYHYAELAGVGTYRAEAAHFWQRARRDWLAGDLLMVDVEVCGNLLPPQVSGWVTGFMALLASHSGQRALIYSYLSFLQHTVPDLGTKGDQFVLAAWGGEIPDLGGGRERFAHQYTDSVIGPQPHAFAGIGAADGNLLTRRALRSLTRRP